jgi:hypothetical protein
VKYIFFQNFESLIFLFIKKYVIEKSATDTAACADGKEKSVSYSMRVSGPTREKIFLSIVTTPAVTVIDANKERKFLERNCLFLFLEIYKVKIKAEKINNITNW